MRAGRRVAIGAGSLAVLLGALDTYVVVTIMTDIMRDVAIPINKIQQVTPIVTGYLLGYVAAMPLLGRASDRFGRKLLLQASLAGFAIGSVVTATSHDLTTLVVGRVIQGTASGALLPVTLALAADLWAQRNRAAVLGGIGAAQELGSVLGPLYGIFIVWLLNTWRDVFWINVPLAVVAMAMIQFSLPPRDKGGPPERVDVVGGVLLAIALGLAVVGLYNPAPDGRQVFPSWGWPVLGGALVAAIAFGLWERFARTRLIEPAGVHFRPFLAALGASVTAGAALMVTLVNVELFGQGVLELDKNQAAGLLLRFLIALPMMDTDLALAGIGLGLVIGPLTSATLRVVPPAQHGIASSAVVVARMIGMLVGIAALSAWGLYRFNQILAGLPDRTPPGASLAARLEAEADNYRLAFSMQYGEIFAITAIICVVGAVLALFISGRHEHADAPEPDSREAVAARN